MKLPEHMKSEYTVRSWKTKKRSDLRATLKAGNDLRLGCVFTPAYRLIVDALAMLAQAKKMMSVEHWGR